MTKILCESNICPIFLICYEAPDVVITLNLGTIGVIADTITLVKFCVNHFGSIGDLTLPFCCSPFIGHPYNKIRTTITTR